MKRMLARYTSSVLVVLATVFVTTMSSWYLHMPEAPEELIKK